MHITASAVSLNVDDERASAEFMARHFGFREEMSAEGFVSLSREDAGFNIVFLRKDLATLKPPSLRGTSARGLLIAFVVDDVDREYERLAGEGLSFTTPIETEPWGERYFQVTDPNGVIIQLVQWMTPPAETL